VKKYQGGEVFSLGGGANCGSTDFPEITWHREEYRFPCLENRNGRTQNGEYLTDTVTSAEIAIKTASHRSVFVGYFIDAHSGKQQLRGRKNHNKRPRHPCGGGDACSSMYHAAEFCREPLRYDSSC